MRVEFCGIPATPHEEDMNCARHILLPISSSPPPFSLLSPPHSIHSLSPSSLPSVLVLHSLFPLWIGIYTHACVPVCVSDQRSVNSLGHSSFLQPWGVSQKKKKEIVGPSLFVQIKWNYYLFFLLMRSWFLWNINVNIWSEGFLSSILITQQNFTGASLVIHGSFYIIWVCKGCNMQQPRVNVRTPEVLINVFIRDHVKCYT